MERSGAGSRGPQTDCRSIWRILAPVHRGSTTLVCVLGLVGTGARAQGVPSLPRLPSGTFSDELRDQGVPDSRPRPSLKIETPAPATEDAAATQRIAVRRFRYEGSDVLSSELLDTLVAPLLAKNADGMLSFADIDSAAVLITQAYADAGYGLTFALVPVQRITNGEVTLRIVEGYVDKIELVLKPGSVIAGRDRLMRAIEKRFAAMVKARPLRTRDLERAILSSSDLGGVEVSVIVKPSAEGEGAATLQVLVESDPAEASLRIDNRLRRSVSKAQFAATVGIHSTLVPGDALTLDLRTAAPTRAFRSSYVQYELPLHRSGLAATLSYSAVRSRGTRGVLELLDFRGREEVARIGLSYPARRSRTASLSLGLDFTAIRSESSLFDVTIVSDRVRTAQAYASYDWFDASGFVGLARVSLSRGLSGLGASSSSNPLASRGTGTPDFTALNFSLSGSMPVAWPGTVLRIESEAQVGLGGRALASRECNYGGERFGRAYDYGVLGGEHCFSNSIELAHNIAVGRIAAQPYLFLDSGIVRQSGPIDPSEERTIAAWSGGMGLRASLRGGISGGISASWPGVRRLESNGRNGPRLFGWLGMAL